MEKYARELPAEPGLKFFYSDGDSKVTTSTSHGGFDNDAATLNAIMTTILGAAPEQPFRPDEMEGF